MPLSHNLRGCLFCIFLASCSWPLWATAQVPIDYNIFNRSGTTKINITTPSIAAPRAPSFPNITTVRLSPMSAQGINTIGIGQDNITQNNQRMIAQDLSGAALPTEEQRTRALHQELMEDDFYRRHIDYLEKSKYYHNAYAELLKLDPDSFSITRAVFITENAWYDNKYTFDGYQKRMELEAKVIKQILKTEQLKADDPVALNYAIQKRFRQGGKFYDAKTKSYLQVKPFQYDFQDITGQKAYTQLLATKMLITGKGQCHSMPLVYLMIAERMGTKAWLSMAPQHSFIRFLDKKGNLHNFESTNGNVVSSTWLNQSGYITAAALKNKIYLDTLSSRHLYAQVLSDLLNGYLNKFHYDDFAEHLKDRILELSPNNLTALMVDANIRQAIAWQQIKQAGMPKEEDLPNYPAAYQAYLAMQAAHQRIDNTGFQEMPPEAYQRWLKSFEAEKQKQETRELQRRMQAEIMQMKRTTPRSTVTDRTKG